MGLFSKLVGRLVRPVGAAPVSDEEALKELIRAEASHYLNDIEWRYKQARDLLAEAGGVQVAAAGAGVSRMATAEDLNILRHNLTGFTVSNNTGATGTTQAGYIRWQALHIVYAGVDYTITDGASNLKYHTFVKPATGTSVTLTSSNTKPVLGPDDLLVFINDNGTAIIPGQGQGSLPQAVADGTVDNGALANGAVSGAKIADNGIGSGKLGTGAINDSTQFGSGVVNTAALGNLAVDDTKLKGGAVTAGKIGTGAINAANLFSGKIITNAQLVDKTINTGVIADNAVTSTQLNGGAVTAGKIASGAINGSGLFTTGVVDSAAIGTGAVQPTKLNVLTHVLY